MGKEAMTLRRNLPRTLIPLAGMYERTAQQTGKRYFTGYLGKAKVLLLENTNVEEGQPGWTLFLTARPDQRGSGEHGK